MKNILLITQDGERLARQIEKFEKGFRAQPMTGLDDVGRSGSGFEPDVILVQYWAPGVPTGKHLIAALREHRPNLPLIALCEDDDEARVAALEAGADDAVGYCGIPELAARIQARLRRVAMRNPTRSNGSCIITSAMVLDQASQRVFCGGNEIDLTVTEFRIVARLAESAGMIMGRRQLVRCCGEEAGMRSVDAHINRIRQKLGALSGVIKTGAKGEGKEGYYVEK